MYNRLIFEMNECRVQTARIRKGLEDYPCKSVGMVEYPAFARTIDPRLVTECLGCPPDPHPKEWFCAWRFTLEGPQEDGPTEARTPPPVPRERRFRTLGAAEAAGAVTARAGPGLFVVLVLTEPGAVLIVEFQFNGNGFSPG